MPQTYDDARQVAPGWDIYYLEQEWRSWMADGGLETPHDVDKAFWDFAAAGLKSAVPSSAALPPVQECHESAE